MPSLILVGDVNLMNVADAGVPFARVGETLRAADLVNGYDHYLWRGNAEDRFRSADVIDTKKLQERYGSALPRAAQHVANLGGFDPDEMAFATPRTFRSAITSSTPPATSALTWR